MTKTTTQATLRPQASRKALQLKSLQVRILTEDSLSGLETGNTTRTTHTSL
jgi:hypothetical protein